MLFGAKKAVFFGAHTDDEMIAAGTLHRLVREGCQVVIVAFGPAAIQGDRAGVSDSEVVVLKEFDRSVNLIGGSYRYRGLMPSVRLHEMGQEIADIAFRFCEEIQPDLAFILSPDDENPAHAECGRQCERVMRGRVPVVLRCQYPWNYQSGRATFYSVLEPEDLIVKGKVIDCYGSQKFRYDYGPMLTHYAYADGLSVKRFAAERFEIVRAVL